MLTIAHRAGNGLATLRAALAAGVDLVEADVHRYKRTLEIRHRKWLGPALLWERDELVRRRAVEVPVLSAVLATAGHAGAGRLMLDLKGVHPGLAPAVAAELRAAVPGAPVVICTQHWWMLGAFAPDPHVRLVLSAGSRRGLARLLARLALSRPRAFARSRLRAFARSRPRACPRSAQRAAARPFGVSVRRDLLTPPAVDALRSAVPHVLTWPVDTEADLADARRLGVTGVIGKNLPLLAGLS
jgi:glycerophosphoryl diester phosphodiesterase